MSEGETPLALRDGEPAPDQLKEDASILADCSSETFKVILKTIFEEHDIKTILGDEGNLTATINEQTKLENEDSATVLNFLRWTILSTGQSDIIESQIEQDLTTLGLTADQAEKLADKIDARRDKIRAFLLTNSQIDPAPRLLNVTWNVEKVISTSTVENVNDRRVLLEFTVDNNGEQESIVVQASGENLRNLLSTMGGLQNNLYDGIQDLE